MTWRFPPDAPETVHIYGVKQNGDSIAFDNSTPISKNLRDCNSGYSFDYSSISSFDVKRVIFCVFLADRNFNSPNMRVFQSMSRCFVSVIIGRANVQYDVRSKPCGSILSSHRILVRSSSTFDAGILGYSYDFKSKDITIELPGQIKNGLNEYPLIYLPRESMPPDVCLAGGSNSDIMVENKRISTFRWPFSRKNRI